MKNVYYQIEKEWKEEFYEIKKTLYTKDDDDVFGGYYKVDDESRKILADYCKRFCVAHADKRYNLEWYINVISFCNLFFQNDFTRPRETMICPQKELW